MRSNPFIKNRNGIAIWIELLLHRHELSHVLSLACRQAFLKRFFDSSVVVPVFYTDHPSCLARVFALLTLLYDAPVERLRRDRKSTRLNSSHRTISYAVFCL